MGRPRTGSPLSRRILVVFGGVLALITAELVWWITFHIRTAHAQTATQMEFLTLERQWAAKMIVIAAQKSTHDDADAPPQILSAHFPDLQWQAGAPSTPELALAYPGMGLQVAEARLTALNRRELGHIRMFVWEGAFFLAMLMVGAWLVLRTLRYEVNLMRQQTNFLSAVTHELKSPLASIRLYTETMQLRDPAPEARRRYLTAMHIDVERLETLVGNLLAVARLEAGQFVVHVEVLDLVQEVARGVQTMQTEMLERQTPINLHLPEGVELMVRIDPGALQTVLRNLLDNAAKYGSASGTPVHIHVEHDGSRARIRVQNQGIGIDAGELDKIFRKFYRVGNEMVRKNQGSGLGLYLVEQLVLQSNGTVEVTSAGMGQGATFLVSLPLASQKPARTKASL